MRKRWSCHAYEHNHTPLSAWSYCGACYPEQPHSPRLKRGNNTRRPRKMITVMPSCFFLLFSPMMHLSTKRCIVWGYCVEAVSQSNPCQEALSLYRLLSLWYKRLKRAVRVEEQDSVDLSGNDFRGLRQFWRRAGGRFRRGWQGGMIYKEAGCWGVCFWWRDCGLCAAHHRPFFQK